MSDLSPGQEVTVSGSTGGPARLLYVRGESARVRMAVTGRERTVALGRVSATPERKPLTLAEADRAPATIADMLAPIQRVYDQSFRPVPKPATLRSEPYLAYVRKHPCCLCGRSEGIEAHHWSHHGGVMGAKVDDYRTVPLCQEHHRYWHDHGTLPEMDRETSEQALLREQAWLLRAWLDNETPNYGDMVDALIRAIGGADA